MKEAGIINYRGKEYTLPFNLNVMEQIQDEYGTLDKWELLSEDEEPNIKALKFGLMAMLNEGIEIENEENGTKEKLLTNKQVGRIISEIGVSKVFEKIDKTITESTEAEEKNA